ncbi:uncharacterized protein FOMMEDRAFT_71069, partial [Fomitiporia mediterranea MF3/22]|uniref:uncharacterized protein n=1 Tax=Fomitiporia mediterranea (strain MF3/22) TaxID=694068 RepID=UPI0004407F98
DELEELLLDCRYGELESVTTFIDTYGVNVLANAHDERGNNVLHMCAANGHDDILAHILSLPNLPTSLLTSGNDAGNTPLHWACVNSQLACAKLLVNFRSSSSPFDIKLGPALILARNSAGHTPLGEAERNGWDEGARWLVSVMDLQLASSSSSSEEADVENKDDDVNEDKNG